MLRLLRGTGPGVILLAALLAGAFWFRAFGGNSDTGSGGAGGMVLYQLLTDVTGTTGTWATITAFILMLVNSIILISFNTGSFFIPERTFLPGIQYIILVSVFPCCLSLNPVLPASFLLLLAIIRISGTYRTPGTAYNFFEAGLLIGTGSLFYASLVWFGVLLFAGIALLRTFNIKEVIISVLGLATPWVLLTGILYVAGHNPAGIAESASQALFSDIVTGEWSRLEIVTASFTGLSLLISLAHLFSVFNTKKVKSRKIFSLLLWLFIVTLAVYFALPGTGRELVYILAMPAGYILSHYYVFMKKKKIVPEIIFTGTIILVLLNLFPGL